MMGCFCNTWCMTGLLVGCARCSTARRTSPQRDLLHAMGFDPKRVHVDYGLTGTSRDRPGCAKR